MAFKRSGVRFSYAPQKEDSQSLSFFLCSKLCSPPAAQVLPLSGAGAPHSWRRWVFWWGTCTAKRSPTRSSGAGPHPFSSPAPKTIGTCANPFSRKPSGLQSIDCQEILTEPRQDDNAVILPNTLKISNLSCEIFVAEEGS